MKLQKANKLTLLLLLTVSFLTSSCLKDSGTDYSTIVSALTVVHASPNSSDFEFILDNQRSQQTISYPNKRLPYFPAYSGSRFVRIYETGNFNTPVYDVEIKLIQGKYYSLFIGGKSESLTSVLIEDDMTIPAQGKAKIRFINLSPDSDPLDFKLSGDNTIASNKKFKEYTGFQEVNVGNYTATIESHDGNEIELPLDLTIESGKIYTIWARGLVDTTVDEERFDYSVIVNNLD